MNTQHLTVRGTAPKRPMTLPSDLPIPIIRRQLAWAAGLFEGDGDVSAASRRHELGLHVTQAGSREQPPDVLRRFQIAVGGIGYVRGPFKVEGRRKPKWRYFAVGLEAVQAVLAMLWPWLGPVKRGQARDALLAYGSRPVQERRPRVRFGRPLNVRCKRGHDYSDARIDARGVRYCRHCEAIRHGRIYKGETRRRRKSSTSERTPSC
jgi:hypothetical protein